MKYRVEVDVSFAEEKDALAFIDAITPLADKIQPPLVMTGKEPSLDQPMKISYHKCYHDEPIPGPCGTPIVINIKQAKVAMDEKAAKVGG
jgi:hypothetical protein